MDTPQVPVVPVVPIPVEIVEPLEKKKRFYRNPKVVVGLVTSFIAGGAVVIIASLRGTDSDSDSNSDTPDEDDETVVDTYKETTTS